MLNERAIINALIIAASFVLAPFVISEFLTVDYLPALVIFAAALLAISFFWIKQNLVICPFVGEYVTGSLNFLPIALTFAHVGSICLILYYITGYVVIRQKSIRLGKSMFFWPIIVVTGIVLYHNHSMNVAATGGESEGAKPAILIYLVVIAYFCAINLPTPSVRVLSKIPFYCVIVTIISSIPYLLTTVVPGLAPYLYVATSNVNLESYVDSVTGGTGGVISKLAALGPVGTSLQAYVLAYYPMGTWLRPGRWWIIALSLCCFILVASSGYRSIMFTYFFSLVVGTWCYYSWRAIILPVVAAVAVLVLLTASSDNIIDLPVRKLPIITQRTLSFLPGDWDPEAVESGNGSNEFRENIENIYLKEYFDKSPLFGNGFTIHTSEFHYWSDRLAGHDNSGFDMKYVQAKAFIEGKQYHTGWISVYDCVGALGTIGFVIFALNLMRVNTRLLFGPKADKQSSLFPIYVWFFCNLTTGFVAYWTVFGSFSDEMIALLVISMVLSHLSDLDKKTEAPLVPLEMQGHVEMPRISGAYYGRG